MLFKYNVVDLICVLHHQKAFLMKLISFGNRRNHRKQDLVDRVGDLICLQASI